MDRLDLEEMSILQKEVSHHRHHLDENKVIPWVLILFIDFGIRFWHLISIKSSVKTVNFHFQKDTTRTSRPKVGAIHKKMNPNAIGAPKDTETKKKQMEEAMQMLGCSMVNTEIIRKLFFQSLAIFQFCLLKLRWIWFSERLEKDSKQNKDGGGKAQMSSRQGDIAFSLQKKPNRKPKDDDTLYPLNEKPENANNRIPGDAESTEVQEDLEEEPNSENYMWNTREIHYTCVDMIRNIDKNVITEATGIDEEGGDPQKIQWDPFAPLNVLQNRLVFDCQTLRKNTLISTALSYPDKNEKKAAMSKSKAASAMKKLVSIYSHLLHFDNPW